MTRVRWALVLGIPLFAYVMGYLSGQQRIKQVVSEIEAKSSHVVGELSHCYDEYEFQEYLLTKCLDSYNSRVGERLGIDLDEYLNKSN